MSNSCADRRVNEREGAESVADYVREQFRLPARVRPERFAATEDIVLRLLVMWEGVVREIASEK